MTQETSVLGIDIGGSGIKAAPINAASGTLTAERHRIETPQPSKPPAVAAVIQTMREHFDYSGPIGCTFPAIVKNGVTLSAANVDPSWSGADAQTLFSEACDTLVLVLNDADAAGMAEMTLGAGQGETGTVLMLTFGTGIGSALFVDGKLVPNTELGHSHYKGYEHVEHYASARVREAEGLKWSAWGERVNEVLNHFHFLFSPDLVIIGGGVSKKSHKYFEYLTIQEKTRVVPARFLNEAGIVGAAMAAHQHEL